MDDPANRAVIVLGGIALLLLGVVVFLAGVLVSK